MTGPFCLRCAESSMVFPRTIPRSVVVLLVMVISTKFTPISVPCRRTACLAVSPVQPFVPTEQSLHESPCRIAIRENSVAIVDRNQSLRVYSRKGPSNKIQVLSSEERISAGMPIAWPSLSSLWYQFRTTLLGNAFSVTMNTLLNPEIKSEPRPKRICNDRRITHLAPNNPPTADSRECQGVGLGELLQRCGQRDDLSAAATIPAFDVGRESFLLGADRGAVDTLSSFVKLWAGGWSDRVRSRKRLVVVGYAMAAVARPLTAVITAPWQLLGIRMGDRFGKGIRTAPRDALIADSTAPEIRGRAFGFHRGMDHLGAAVGPLLAAAFLWFYPGQLRPLFLMTLLPGLCVLVLLVAGLREERKATQSQERIRWTLQPFDSRFRLYLLALVVFTLGNSSDAFLLVRASELGVPTVLLPILWCGFHVFKSGGNMLAGRAVDVIGPDG